MKTYTKEQLEEKYDALPEEVKEAMMSVDEEPVMNAIMGNHNLSIDKVGEIASETRMVMFGLTHPRDFIGNVEKRAGVSKETAREIGNEINQKIFAKIRESLVKIHGIRDEEREASSEGRGASNEEEKTESKDEIMKVIEKPEEESTRRVDSFEQKTKGEITRKPMEEREVDVSKYPAQDPYREAIE